MIVARAFPSPSSHWKNQDKPFDPALLRPRHACRRHRRGRLQHADRRPRQRHISGIAPKAYLGNYKALTVPTDGFGLDGNSAEIAKAIDQAVADGMNVINLSIGEPAVAPQRDIVVQALENAAAAGVVPVVAAGNDYEGAGLGSIGSPANTPSAITVAASTGGSWYTAPDIMAGFSSAGPAPISLLPKPDVTAPGVEVVSSVPPNAWAAWDGTSMATPEVAGAAALLLQSHPTWTVEDVKSALVSTAVHAKAGGHEASTLREGGGRIDIPVANAPLLFTQPTTLGWGLVRRGSSSAQDARDRGRGWRRGAVDGVGRAAVAPHRREAQGDLDHPRRRAESQARAHGLESRERGRRQGLRRADARQRRAPRAVLVPRRGPEAPARSAPDTHSPGRLQRRHGGQGRRACRRTSTRKRGVAGDVPTQLGGPEEVFRFRLRKPVANFGVAVLSGGCGLAAPRSQRRREPTHGYTGVPATLNPYGNFGDAAPVVGAVLPTPGVYDFVFDTPTGAQPRPVHVPLLDQRHDAARRQAAHADGHGRDADSSRRARRGSRRRSAARSPSMSARGSCPSRYAHGTLSIPTSKAHTGRIRITVQASDYQELKNMEDVGPVLPNTRVVHAFVTARASR